MTTKLIKDPDSNATKNQMSSTENHKQPNQSPLPRSGKRSIPRLSFSAEFHPREQLYSRVINPEIADAALIIAMLVTWS